MVNVSMPGFPPASLKTDEMVERVWLQSIRQVLPDSAIIKNCQAVG